MSDHVTIDIDGLKEIANALKTEKENLDSIYKKDITTILNNSYRCFQKQGINYDSFVDSTQKLFQELDSSMTDVIAVLSNNIIPKYEDVFEEITTSFNNDFASKMNSLLEKKEG